MPRVSASANTPIGVLAKVLKILEAIQGTPSGLSLKAICDRTGIHKSTAHRFLKHLEGERYLLRTDAGTYLIGPRFGQLTSGVDHRATLQAVARPILWELWKSTQETVNLAILDHGSVLYVDVLESPHEFRLSSRVGTRRPIHVTALGKALAAFLSEEEKNNIFSALTFQPLTPKTIMNLVQLRQELSKVRRQGYAVDDEETTLGARCVSAPILATSGEAVAAVSVSGPIARISTSQVSALAAAVMNATGSISAALGHSRDKTAPSAKAKLRSIRA
jgi:IclR family transcriptional regulator, acetate operon repressor